MDRPSLIAAVTPITTLIALSTSVALAIAAASRSGRGHPGRPLGRADDAAPVEYLYVLCVRYHGHPAETPRWVQEVPIVKKTAKLIYYTSDSWDRRQAVVSPGCISREQFETDSRCHDHCPAGTRGAPCARHGYPAGVIPVPGDPRRPAPAGRLFFATREAAEEHLHRGEHQRAERAARKHHSSRSYAAPWPTPTPTVAARLSSSSTRAAGTRRRYGPPDGLCGSRSVCRSMPRKTGTGPHWRQSMCQAAGSTGAW